MKQAASTKGTNKGKFKLDLPNMQELDQMSNEELETLLQETRERMMKMQGLRGQKSFVPGGNLRELRRVVARILTIRQKRG